MAAAVKEPETVWTAEAKDQARMLKSCPFLEVEEEDLDSDLKILRHNPVKINNEKSWKVCFGQQKP